MMNLDSPQTRYAMLRTALELFHRPPADLDEEQSRELQHQVNGQLAIARRLLERGEARQVVVPEDSVDQACASLRAEYQSDEAFDETLSYNGLSRDSLREALRYDLKVEAALEQMLGDEAKVSDEEVEIYYLQHRERFTLPETRAVAHILVTINDEYAENRREQALQRITSLHSECDGSGERLKSLAERHSECPTAMQQGVIGRVKPGQLYRELDEVLFAMDEGEVSGIVESEVGLHVLYCESIHLPETVSLDDVREKLREMLERKRRAAVLKERLMGKDKSDAAALPA